MSNFPVVSLPENILSGIREGNLPEGTGLKIKRYLRSSIDGLFSSCVVYVEEWDIKKTSCQLRGACFGYAGAGEYEGNLFIVNSANDSHKVLDISEAEEDVNSELFNALLYECARMYSEVDGKYRLSGYAKKLIAQGEKLDDGSVYMDRDFDGDSLDIVSHSWLINLRFNY